MNKHALPGIYKNKFAIINLNFVKKIKFCPKAGQQIFTNCNGSKIKIKKSNIFLANVRHVFI